MDETKDTKGLPSVNTEKAPGGSEGTTPKETEAKTYTESEVEKALQADRIKRGRDDKSFEQRETAVKAKEDAIAEQERQRDAAELAEAQKDPDKLAVYQSKQTERQRARSLDERETNLARDKAEHEAEIKAARETQLEIEIWRIAETEGVDPAELKDTMNDLNLTTVEQAQSVAKRLNKKPEETTDKKTTHDSLVTSGGKASSEGKPARVIYADNFREKKK